MAAATRRFDRLIREAEQQPFQGWDFSWLAGRMMLALPTWDYAALARGECVSARSMLDLGTGGGEFLASLAPLPPLSVATEEYRPNVPLARDRLAPHGAKVIEPPSGGTLPFADGCFDLILDRHEAFNPCEVVRVLRQGGVFLTQQVGGRHFADLNEALVADPYPYHEWRLSIAKAPLAVMGLAIVLEAEEYPQGEFRDVGAVVYYLRATPWQIPDFSVERYERRLLELHERIEREGPLSVRSHNFIIRAVKQGMGR